MRPVEGHPNPANLGIESIVGLRVFDAIARTGSLSGAGRSLGLSLTAISKRLKRLEDEMGMRLVHRTTRQLAFTPEGQPFLDHVRVVLSAVEAADDLSAGGTLKGAIRVTAAVAFAQRQIGPRLPAFLGAHPDVAVQLITSDRLIDLVEENVDVAFRQAALGESAYVTRKIAPDGRLLCESPAYLAKAGTPRIPDDLTQHDCLTVGDSLLNRWQLRRDGKVVTMPIKAVAGSTDGEVVHAAALAGGGIVMKSSWDVIDDIRTGRLIHVLPEWWGEERSLHVVQPVRQHQPRRVITFIKFIENELRIAADGARGLHIFPEGDL